MEKPLTKGGDDTPEDGGELDPSICIGDNDSKLEGDFDWWNDYSEDAEEGGGGGSTGGTIPDTGDNSSGGGSSGGGSSSGSTLDPSDGSFGDRIDGDKDDDVKDAAMICNNQGSSLWNIFFSNYFDFHTSKPKDKVASAFYKTQTKDIFGTFVDFSNKPFNPKKWISN